MFSLSNILSKLKAPAPDHWTSDPSNMAPSSLTTGWDEIAPEEAAGYYTDRILLLLGPSSVLYHILLVDIPPYSKLLTRVSHLPPAQRAIRLTTLDVNMIDFYIHPHSTASLAHAFSWNEVIKLFLAADVLQDETVQKTALAALKKKAATAQERKEDMYSREDYQLVKTHKETLGGASKLLQTLDGIAAAQAVHAQSEVRAVGSVSSPGHASAAQGERKRDSHVAGEYVDGEAREKRGAGGQMRQERRRGRVVDERDHPVRQPTVPPSVEALREGGGNDFVRPGHKGGKKR
ncbi:hypothetical protein N0V83_008222 [Neocucurbitaria cava]|uniref:Uncharacterized protein n=1 Tax=Neocucurbitaria cava TaxID=798079 RepID=A0A9W9CJG0_9PLEO|nr:hypothetical protein N0V83_008222 [Neocucurbitaria cava]